MLQIHRPPKQKVGVAEQPQEVARSVVEQDQSQQEIILKQDITQQQSFEFVQTLLLVSVSLSNSGTISFACIPLTAFHSFLRSVISGQLLLIEIKSRNGNI